MAEVFLLGAGFSRAISEHMPLLADLSEEVQQRVSEVASSTIRDMFRDDVEMGLTYLSQSHPWLPESENLRNRALFLDLSRVIAQVVEECERDAIQDFPPHWLSALITWWHERRAGVITLNYDTLIERAAAQADIVPEGDTAKALYPISLTRAASRSIVVVEGKLASLKLCKLHGSINWFYSGTAAFYGETIYYVPTDTQTREEGEREEVEDKVPLVVPPLTEKSPYFQHETIRTLWALSAAALREATHVFCLGYSLPLTDIGLRFFLQANAPQAKVPFVIVNLPHNGIANHFRDMLPNYDIWDRFISDDPIPQFVEALVAGKIEEQRL